MADLAVLDSICRSMRNFNGSHARHGEVA
jgi:hypothetical protein